MAATLDYHGKQYPTDEFERQFNPRLTASDPDTIQPRRAALSEAFRTRRKHALGLPYGDRARETVDIFPADRARAPVLVYFHGGYWRTGTARENNFVAEPFVRAGVSVAVVNYDLCPMVRIGDIVGQARRAIRWLHENVADHGGDPGRLHLAGHSAGAHLSALALADESGTTPLEAIRGATLISGIYDLAPVRMISANADIGIAADDLAPFGALNHPPKSSSPVLVAVGGAESGEWRRQSRLYADLCGTAGAPVAYFEMPGADHYDIVFDLLEPGNELVAATLQQIES